LFLLNSRIPLVSNSSKLEVNENNLHIEAISKAEINNNKEQRFHHPLLLKIPNKKTTPTNYSPSI